MAENNKLEYKNFYLFYQTLYNRFFDLVFLLIDENKYDIPKVKNSVVDFLDNYSYYLIKKQLITEEDKEKTYKDVIKELNDFQDFYKSLNDYPSEDYIKSLLTLKRADYKINSLGITDYQTITKEYYLFYDSVLKVLKEFVLICSKSGFFPNIKSSKSVTSISFKNFDNFFIKIEELKLKLTDITSNINLRNTFKSRRASYCVLVVFSAYLRNKDILNYLEEKLNFSFVKDDKLIKQIKSLNNYDTILEIPLHIRNDLNNKILDDLKQNISVLKRYISYEFGELDLHPTIKKKYAYDPTGV